MLRWPLKHFVKFLLGAVCVALLGAVPRSHAAEGTLPVPALRDLNDGMGWRNPQYYKTIQAVDLDRDGQSEVLSRWIDGLHIYRFHDGALVHHSFLPELSDKAGFYEPSWYETIHAAVLDPKRKSADIVVREADGIHIFRFATKRQTWREVGGSTARPFADHAVDGTDWSQPQYYQTIRLTDLTKDGSAELIGRGKNGLVVYSWNNASERWQPLTTEGVLADGDGSERPDSYETIQLLDVNGDGVPELLARSANGMQTLQWTGNGFTPLAVSGPFGNGEGSTLAHRYRSIHTFLDSGGQAWLYGMRAGSGAGQWSRAAGKHRGVSMERRELEKRLVDSPARQEMGQRESGVGAARREPCRGPRTRVDGADLAWVGGIHGRRQAFEGWYPWLF